MNATFIEEIQKANTVLLTTPECVDLNIDRNVIAWTYNSPAVKKARVSLRSILNDLWQSGSYNYEQFAKSLRIDVLTIQALIDEQFIEAKGL